MPPIQEDLTWNIFKKFKDYVYNVDTSYKREEGSSYS